MDTNALGFFDENAYAGGWFDEDIPVPTPSGSVGGRIAQASVLAASSTAALSLDRAAARQSDWPPVAALALDTARCEMYARVIEQQLAAAHSHSIAKTTLFTAMPSADLGLSRFQAGMTVRAAECLLEKQVFAAKLES